MEIVTPFGLPASELSELSKVERELQRADQEVERQLEAKNEFEEMIYVYRDRLDGPLMAYSTREEREELFAMLQGREDWLYNDGESETRERYLAELTKLRKQMELVEDRFDAFESLVEELNGLNEERSRVEGLLDETTQAFLKEVSSGEQAGGGGEKEEEEPASVTDSRSRLKAALEATGDLCERATKAYQGVVDRCKPPAVSPSELKEAAKNLRGLEREYSDAAAAAAREAKAKAEKAEKAAEAEEAAKKEAAEEATAVDDPHAELQDLDGVKVGEEEEEGEEGEEEEEEEEEEAAAAASS